VGVSVAVHVNVGGEVSEHVPVELGDNVGDIVDE
jgi:hypothetical protein